MRNAFDRRVVAEPLLAAVRRLQGEVPFRLAGGAALSGAWLSHRLTHDLDFFTERPEGVHELLRVLPAATSDIGAVSVVTSSPTFVRCVLTGGPARLELDLVHDATPRLDSTASSLEGIALEPLADMRAAKITCLLSRSEPRDLVDLLFLERAGYRVDADLPLALKKDAGIDPATLAWLLKEFPTAPMPEMLQPLDETELGAFKRELAERLRRLATG